MKGLPYFCWYPRDAEADDVWREADFAGRGFYICCLNYAWTNGGIPKDPAKRARALCTTRAVADRLWKQIESKFIEDPEHPSLLINERQELGRLSAIERHLRGKKGAAAKWEKAAAKASAQASSEAMLKQDLSNGTEQADPRAYDSDYASEFVFSGKESVRENPPPEPVSLELFQEIMGLFVALGRGARIPDLIRCENAWKGLTAAERKRAHEHAMRSRAEWQTRPTSKIAQPWNYLAEKHWERDAPRLLQQTRAPTKADLANEEASRIFREMQR